MGKDPRKKPAVAHPDCQPEAETDRLANHEHQTIEILSPKITTESH